ncbi:MAG: TRAP transporter small permease subunit [Alphaproteobacteria bacterium]|nr:TRAP transporter small permease subunit [Alphaproteobacteria bacterium]
MNSDAPSPPAAGPASGIDRLLDRLLGLSALLGGILALAIALLVCTSVLGRWIFYKPVTGDFEFVRIATAIGVFAYMPYTQVRRGNIMVDTFTQGLGPRTLGFIDAFWDIVYAAFMAFAAYGLFLGAIDARENYETTQELQLQMWPFIATSSVLCALVAATSVATAVLIAVRGK